MKILSVDGSPELPLVEGGHGTARAVVWSGTGAKLRAMHLIELGAGGATVPQTHDGEAVYAILDGDGSAHDDSERAEHEIETGSMVHIEPGTTYRLVAGGEGMRAVGGPAPIDPRLYEGIEG